MATSSHAWPSAVLAGSGESGGRAVPDGVEVGLSLARGGRRMVRVRLPGAAEIPKPFNPWPGGGGCRNGFSLSLATKHDFVLRTRVGITWSYSAHKDRMWKIRPVPNSRADARCSPSSPKAGAVCGSPARTDLNGGRVARRVPTVLAVLRSEWSRRSRGARQYRGNDDRGAVLQVAAGRPTMAARRARLSAGQYSDAL